MKWSGLTDSVDESQHESANVQVATRANCLLDVQVCYEDTQVPRTVRRCHYLFNVSVCVSPSQNYTQAKHAVSVYYNQQKKTTRSTGQQHDIQYVSFHSVNLINTSYSYWCHRVVAADCDHQQTEGDPLLITIDGDVQPQNFGVHTAWREARDRDTWQQVASTATLC